MADLPDRSTVLGTLVRAKGKLYFIQREGLQPQQALQQPQQPLHQPQQSLHQPCQPQQSLRQPQQPQQPLSQPQQPLSQPQQRPRHPQQPLRHPQQPLRHPQQPLHQPQQPRWQPLQQGSQQQQKQQQTVNNGTTTYRDDIYTSCRACEYADELITCAGPCMRYFSERCLSLNRHGVCQECRDGYGLEVKHQDIHHDMWRRAVPEVPPLPPAAARPAAARPAAPPVLRPLAALQPAGGRPAAVAAPRPGPAARKRAGPGEDDHDERAQAKRPKLETENHTAGVRRVRRTADVAVAAQTELVVDTYRRLRGGGRVSTRARRQTQWFRA